MKQNDNTTPNQGHSTNMLLVAVTPDSNLSTDGTALDGVSGLRGSGIGATIEADELINNLTKKVHEMDARVKKHIESYVIEYLALASPPLIINKLSDDLYSKIKWRGIKLVRKEDSFLAGMHYSIWLEQRGKRLGQVIRVDYSDTSTCNIQIHSNE